MRSIAVTILVHVVDMFFHRQSRQRSDQWFPSLIVRRRGIIDLSKPLFAAEIMHTVHDDQLLTRTSKSSSRDVPINESCVTMSASFSAGHPCVEAG